MAQNNFNNEFTNGLTDGLRKILLAGIGAVATTAEKSQDILEDLVKKGELTVEQGKSLNEELKHTVKENMAAAKEKQEEAAAEAAAETKAPAEEAAEVIAEEIPAEKPDIKDFISRLTPEELSELKKQLEEN